MEKHIVLLGIILLATLLLCGCQPQKNAKFTIGALSFSHKDITKGYTVTIQNEEGTGSFNRVSFSYRADAPFRALFTYRQGKDTLEEELLLSEKRPVHHGYQRRLVYVLSVTDLAEPFVTLVDVNAHDINLRFTYLRFVGAKLRISSQTAKYLLFIV